MLHLLEVSFHTLLLLQNQVNLTCSIVGAVTRYFFVLLLVGAGSWHQMALKDRKCVAFLCVSLVLYIVDAQ